MQLCGGLAGQLLREQHPSQTTANSPSQTSSARPSEAASSP